MSAELDFKVEQGLRLMPLDFAPVALENLRTMYVEGQIELVEYEADVARIMRLQADASPEDL